MKNLRDIQEYGDPIDLVYLQKRVSAGGEMKSAIKRLLSDWDAEKEILSPIMSKQMKKHLKELGKAMEAWCNCGT